MEAELKARKVEGLLTEAQLDELRSALPNEYQHLDEFELVKAMIARVEEASNSVRRARFTVRNAIRAVRTKEPLTLTEHEASHISS